MSRAISGYCRDSSIASLFEQQAALRPMAVALACGDAAWTYADLNVQANRLARHLIRRGVRPGDAVAVCLDRSPEMILAFLAILKAGGAYVPLDTAYPPDRLAFMLADSGARLVFTTRELSGQGALPGAEAVCLEDLPDLLQPESPDNLSPLANGDSTAYIIYTSGSTGTPKGVVVPQRGVARLVMDNPYIPFGPGHTFLLLCAVSFDVAVFEIWGALLHGARCAIFPQRLPELPVLAETVQRHQVSVLWLTAGLFNLVMDEAPQCLSGVRYLLAGGEALSARHVRLALQHLPDTQLINGYGPTECSVFATTHAVPRDFPATAGSVPIGRPIAHTRHEILNARLQRVAPGEPGELCLGGDGLAKGYHNRPDLTAAAFIPDPFSPQAGERLYRTGDLVREGADGLLEYLGRIDQQVKIRGHRVEPGEIEVCLMTHPAVRQAVVVARKSRLSLQLVAFVLPEPGSEAALGGLRAFLAARLPAYLVPDFLLKVDELPLTPNGKVDRRRLAALDLGEPEGGQEPSRALNAMEAMVRMVWENVLGTRNIRPEDHFFDLGGDSLLAASMMARLSKRCGRNLPLALLFRHPTLEGLAAEMAREGDFGDRTLITLQEGEGPLAFVYFHGDFSGGGFYSQRLATLLGPEPAFLVMQPNGVQGQPDPWTLERMAARYVDLLQAHRPDGPLVLAGHCNGGVLAHEVARRLSLLGRSVPLVFLLDPPEMDYHAASPCSEQDVATLLRDRSGGQPLENLSPQIRDRVLTEVYLRVCEGHGLKRHDGHVALLLASGEYSDEEARALALEIRPSCGRLSWSRVPGDHLGMVLQEAPALAGIIRVYLAEFGILPR